MSRFETVFAFVETGTFQIDGAIRVLGDHEDKALSGGHSYSNKAPGLSLAAIPVYRALRIFFPPPRSAADGIFVLLRALVVSSLCVLAFARFRSRLLGQGAPAASLVAAAAGFGTPYVFYARSFFSHAWTAALLLLSWDLLKLAEERGVRRRVNVLAIGAGFLAGWAAISEYPVALLALLLAARAASGKSFRRLWLFGLGASVPLALLLLYNATCFGSALVLSSSREALPRYAELSQHGLFGFQMPRLAVALAYLFHPARGLLLFSPFLLWSVGGFFRWWRSGEERADCVFSLAATVLFFLIMCGYPNWHGGWALGDRYLLPVLFLAALAIPRALASPTSRWLFAAAAVFSIANHFLLTLTWPHFPLNVPWPPASASVWFLKRGWIAPNLAAGAGALWAPLLLPLAVVLLVLLTSLATALLPRRRAGMTVFLGIVPLALTVLAPPDLSFGGRLWRAAVFGGFSGRDPGRQELRNVVRAAATPSERQRARDIWRLFGSAAGGP